VLLGCWTLHAGAAKPNEAMQTFDTAQTSQAKDHLPVDLELQLKMADALNHSPHEPLNQSRQAAVAMAKTGHRAAGINQLQKLHQAHPGDAAVTADLIVLLRLDGQNAQISELTQDLDPAQIPSYAVMDWARALRDEKHFVRASRVLESHRHSMGFTAQILYAMVTLESGNPSLAVAALPDRTATGLSPVNLSEMAYVWRRAENPAMALSLSEQALRLSPENPQAIREQVFALSVIGSTSLALEVAKQNLGLFAADITNQLATDMTTVQIRNAVQERRRLGDLNRFKERDIMLETTLKTIQETLFTLKAHGVTLSLDAALIQRARYDQIYVLHELERMAEAVIEFERLLQSSPTVDATKLTAIPAYVRTAIADAYLYTRQPRKAATLYEQLIADNPKAGLELWFALYYAYIDEERYEKAKQLLTEMHRLTPTWIGNQVGTQNGARVDVDQLWAMDAAYRNQEAIGYERLQALVDRAPRNVGLINAKATVERWRGWPEQSLQTTKLAQAYSPTSKDSRINAAENHRELEQFEIWVTEISALSKDFPNDTSIQKGLAQWQDRGRPSVTSEFTTGHSQADESSDNSFVGNRDQGLRTRFNSAWDTNDRRVFLDQRYIASDFTAGTLSYNRLGAGLEWRSNRQNLWGMVHNDQLTGQHLGVALGWSQWLQDQWQYSLSGDTYSLDVPLRAKQTQLSGQSMNAKLNWRQSESRSAYGAVSLMNIDDGNKRIDVASGFTERLFSGPHHFTSGGMDFFAEHNSLSGGAYFNPTQSKSLSLRLDHQWITWRKYERSFTQSFKASAGYAWQDGYGRYTTANFSYEQKIKYSRTWALNYGIGWSSNVYDGGRERRSYGLVGFEGVL
jgi:poly-beta-1,6 N-acetyl-D-glucosamine export porin PgaA